MSVTYQTRLVLDETQWRWLDAYGVHYGRCERQLYAVIARGGDALREKPALMARARAEGLASGRLVEGRLSPADLWAAEGLVRLNAVRGWEGLSLLT